MTQDSRLYRLKAIHIAERLRLKDLRERFSQPPAEFSTTEMVVKYAEDSFLFVYNYGAVVFFNVPEELQEKELNAIHEYRVPTAQGRATDFFSVEVDPSIEVQPGPNNKVFFDRMVTYKLSYPVIKMVCMLLAESTALEYYEVLIENLLEKTNVYSKMLQQKGRRLAGGQELIRFIGLCLDTKQEIISNLYIVDSPDETWENPELDKAHQDLKSMMDVDLRYRALEYKIKIIQESIEIIVDLSKSRRETFLEATIIALIAFDIILGLFKIA